MQPVTPRWEWRTFGADFGDADRHLATLPVEKVQESDETYFLSPLTDANVKVRDALLDIKTLVKIDAAGLQQWRPMIKATFPLDIPTLAIVCHALGVPVPASADGATSLETLRDDVARRGVRAIAVHKRRVRYTVDGCLAELTDVMADGHPVRTFALESEEAALVARAVRRLGLAGRENTSYPRGLKAAVRMLDREV